MKTKKTRKKNNYRQYNFASFHNNYEFTLKNENDGRRKIQI